jgi:methyl-accepting chemotaxis protein
MKREERKKVWIHAFQTRMLIRIGCYWLLYLLALWNLLFVWRLLVEGPGNLLDQYWRFLQDYYPPLILFFALLPVAAWDALKLAHRLVGPLVRVRQALQDVAAGNAIPPLRFREGDYLHELKDDFNAMLEALQRRGVPVLKPAEPAADSKVKGA